MRNFKDKIDSLSVLGTKAERTSQNYTAFLKALETHVLTTFKRPEDSPERLFRALESGKNVRFECFKESRVVLECVFRLSP